MTSMYIKYPKVEKLLQKYKELIMDLLGNEIVAIYLTGSLTYNDFQPSRSDIDLHTILKSKVSTSLCEEISKIHKQLEEVFPEWKNKIEASYTPIYLFSEVMPPIEPRPWYGFDKLYNEAPYGNEWIINNYILQEYGVALYGKPFKELVPLIDISDVKKACIRDFYKEWLPKTDNDRNSLDDNHIQSYVVLNICRILYTINTNKVGSKTVSSEWVKINLLPEYSDLIVKAQNWKYGDIMGEQNTTVRFILKAKELID